VDRGDTSSFSPGRQIAAGIGLFGLTVVIVAAAARLLSSFLPIDFGHYWSGARSLLAGENPYPAAEFFFPPWSILLLGPLTLLRPQAAAVVWLLLSAGFQAYSALSSTHWLGRSVSTRKATGLIALGVLMPPALFAYVTGQVAPIVGAAALIALGLARHPGSHPVPLAVALAVTSLKPHIVILPILICLLELISRRRWAHLAWLAAIALGLVTLGFLILPDWISSLSAALRGGAFLGGPGLVAPGYRGLLEFGVPYWLLVPLAAYVVLLWTRERLTARVAALALCIGLLITPYTRSYDQALLAYPACVALLAEGRQRRLRIVLALAAALVFPWTPAWALGTVVMVLAVALVPGAMSSPRESLPIDRGSPSGSELTSQARNV
jgi:hypothetical protein